jgi:hypothetical protein
MMRAVRLLTPLVALFGGGPACGGAAAPAPASARSASPQDARPDDHGLRGPLLWEVQGKGRASYLFGTIHAGFQADRELPAWIWARLDACDTFIMEADPTSVRPAQIMEAGTLPEGQSLQALLGEKDWKALLEVTGAPASSLQNLKPWLATLFVLHALYPTPVPLDEALRRRAQTGGKELVFLEDWELQTSILAMTGPDELRELLDGSGKARLQLDQMVEAYREGHFERLAELALDPDEVAKNPERHRRLFDDRNRDWIGKLVPHLDRGRTFVAVGAGHFAGDNGLIELLRERGYVLTRRVEP